MPLAGKQLLPRELASELRQYWQVLELTKAIATCLSESLGYIGAWHDNIENDGSITSRDCGLMQINIPSRLIDGDEEHRLRTTSFTPEKFKPIVENNLKAAYELYNQPWERNNKIGIRRWQPWRGYTSGWATFTEWYTWKQVDGKPVGPWSPTGRFLHKAIVGHANYRLLISKDLDQDEAIDFAKDLCVYFKVKNGKPGKKGGQVGWTNIPKPPDAPPKDGVGPRPIPNNGI